MTEVIASPSVRSLAGNMGVDLVFLAARLGRTHLSREDVLGTIAPQITAKHATPPVDHAAFGPVREEPLSRFAKIASANLTAAAAIPTVTHHDSCDATRVEALRVSLRKDGRRLTALAFHVAVLARCLREFPRFNASLSSDGERLILKDYVHIGIAVDTPHGLNLPVIRNADSLRLGEIGEAITDLAGRAQERRIRPTELGGASMSISNLGGIGGEAFTPIVNPPEVAILGITRTEIRPVWDGATFVPRPMVPLDLTYDHRVLNGADAARFLARYRTLFAAPEELLLAPDGTLMKGLS
jgi:pyruvate/2-oxoglutarate dehydrogenase complex dihydrolipoamide acyltransferase (E2) component